MNLIIAGKKAVVKAGSSFEYISENRAFTDSDAYTLSISLPLAECQQNKEIFGNMERMDFNSRSLVLDATIISGEFCKSGVVSVVEADASEIKVQFLEGRSVQNFSVDYDEIFINELDLGSYPVNLPDKPSYDEDADYIPFEWVNDSADGFLNNETAMTDLGLGWATNTIIEGKLSYMPYLLFITKKICDATGFTYDFFPWANSPDRFLLLCNAIPAAWNTPAIASALPHWSFPEFFSQLEKFLVCEFDIDYKTKSISMRYSKDVDSINRTVKIENIVDDFSSDISYDDSLCKYRAASRIKFSDRGDELWKFDSCSWFIEFMMQDKSRVLIFKTEEDYQSWYNNNRTYLGDTTANEHRGQLRGRLFHIEETDRYFIWRVVQKGSPYLPDETAEGFSYRTLSLNRFGDYAYDVDSEESIELKIVPARIDYLSWSRGNAVFLAPSEYSKQEDVDENGITQPYGYSILSKGDDADKSPEYYDKLLIAIWDDKIHAEACPVVDERLSIKQRYKSYLNGIQIKPKEKLKVKFISDKIPDVRSVFLIRGKKYLCEKITATFNDDGMSQLMKGEFYQIAD